MRFNYSKLLGKIRECGLTQAKLAELVGISKTTLSAKLNNQFYFTAIEMYAICEALDIPIAELSEYFFTV